MDDNSTVSTVTSTTFKAKAKLSTKMGLKAKLVLAMLAMVLTAGAAAPAAQCEFGDAFDVAVINDGAGPAQDSVALPGLSRAFWAGTCDIGTAPLPPAFVPLPGAPPAPTPIAGGIGGIPHAVMAPDKTFYQTPVAAPPTPPHCLEWPGPGRSSNPDPNALWISPPSWRMPAHTQAGGHPDGTVTFALTRQGANANISGSIDNAVVDLPPGFAGDPNAVPKCTSAQFDVKPPLCPPSSQVGVLHLELAAAAFSGGENLDGFQGERIYPVYNLEPRKGNVAELGFNYASSEDATSVRLVAKARTNQDFGVTTFIGQIPSALPPRSQEITIWGVPWSAVNDRWRAPRSLQPSDGNLGCTTQPGIRGPDIFNVPSYYIPPAGFTVAGCAQSYDESWGPIKPFISNVTECTGADLSTGLAVDSFQNPGSYVSDGSASSGKIGGNNGDPDPADPDWKRYSAPAPPITGCGKNPFSPAGDYVPSSTGPDAASGLSFGIHIPANDDPPAAVANDPGLRPGTAGYVPAAGAPGHWRSDAGVATAHLDRSVVRLPPGMSINPSAASGLEACSDAQFGVRQLGNPPLFDNGDPFDGVGPVECPQSSIIGTVEATTPVLDEKLTGEMVLGAPKSTDPTSGEMFRTFLVVRNKERGLLAKVYGTATADPATGEITALFDRNPRVPVENIKVVVKGGERGLLANPLSCGEKTINSVFTPWTAAHGGGGVAKTVNDTFVVAGDCSQRFAPTLAAGMDTRAARSNGTFSFRFARQQGEQYLRGLTTKLPQGLLASVKGVPLCSNAAANAGACPAGSKIGIVDAKAGSGDPFILEEKGEVFLTQGYRGGEYGLAVKIRPIAGPFRGAMELSPVIVRQAIHVDRTTAQVTAISDPFPLIHHGIPLRVREVTVLVNRPAFMLTPSNCSAKQIDATLSSDQGANSALTNAFRVAGCANLAFKPKLALRLTGKKQVTTGKHPGIRATVTQKGIPEAGIQRAQVRLPKTLALDVDNAQALCEFEAGTKPDLERHCPKGSIVGRARAVSPLLNDPLAGNVYFVKNVRRSSSGNLIRTLPMIIVALRGEISVNLKGESNVKNGKLVNTFDRVPDAPVSRFQLNINGGKNGIIAVTRTRRSLINLCKTGRQVAEADMDGHNGRRHDFDVNMRKPCGKAGKRSAAQRRKAAAKRKAAKRRAAARRSTS